MKIGLVKTCDIWYLSEREALLKESSIKAKLLFNHNVVVSC